MTEIQGKSILVRVSEGSSYRESTVCTVQYDATTFLLTSFSFSGDGSVWTWGWGKISSVLFFTSLPLPDKRDARLISYGKDIFEVKLSLDLFLNLNSPLRSFYRH